MVPYLIGACTDDPESYRVFVGVHAAEEFIEWLFEIAEGNNTILYGFNVDYDFQAIKSYFMEVQPTSKIEYHLTGSKKFIYGTIRDKTNKITINIRDFWVWDKTFNLSKYYNLIRARAETSPKWQELLNKYQIKELKKLSIVDYTKKNLHESNGSLYYWDDKDNYKQLDLNQELEYLKMDVIGLPLIREYIQEFKDICIDGLGLRKVINIGEVNHAYSIPSFGKMLVSAFLNEEFDWIYRKSVTLSDYQDQDLSYFGGFTANNKHIYKLSNSRNAAGEPNIHSYDVNSMYPYIMHGGLPSGDVFNEPPPGDYVTWYTIRFKKEWKPGILYEYKPEYDCLNNSFFGDNHSLIFLSDPETPAAYYVEKSVFDMFKKVCNSHVEIVKEDIKYQQITRKLTPFIDVIYEKKLTAPTKVERDSFKLILNSLYGKMAERFHQDYWEWNTDTQEFRNKLNDREDRDTILAGLYVTSKARVILFEAITSEIANGNTVLGLDTDSIKLVVNNPVKLRIHKTDLGAWKHEYTMTDFYHNGKKKKYFLYNQDTKEIKVATSGIPSRVIEALSYEDLKTLYDPAHDVLFKDIKNVSQRNKWFQICIQKASVRFNYRRGVPITHIYKDNRIIPYEETK